MSEGSPANWQPKIVSPCAATARWRMLRPLSACAEIDPQQLRAGLRVDEREARLHLVLVEHFATRLGIGANAPVGHHHAVPVGQQRDIVGADSEARHLADAAVACLRVIDAQHAFAGGDEVFGRVEEIAVWREHPVTVEMAAVRRCDDPRDLARTAVDNGRPIAGPAREDDEVGRERANRDVVAAIRQGGRKQHLAVEGKHRHRRALVRRHAGRDVERLILRRRRISGIERARHTGTERGEERPAINLHRDC